MLPSQHQNVSNNLKYEKQAFFCPQIRVKKLEFKRDKENYLCWMKPDFAKVQ